LRVANLILAGCAVAVMAGASTANAAGTGTSGSSGTTASPPPASTSGGAAIAPGPPPVSTPVHPVVQGLAAKIIHGLAYAPSMAPIQVQRAIWAGDAIRHKPYIYGGGHGTWNDAGYDCSGSVSYVLHAAGLIRTSMDSGEMMSWGQAGLGAWITIYTNPGHAFVEIAGIRLDTSAEQDPNPPPGTGPRWRPLVTSTSGFSARHPADL
jgi:cell wall-associated NlpC family hydrolase